MDRMAANPLAAPRRFILLPGETAHGAPSRPRIRRYQLSRLDPEAARLQGVSSSAGFGNHDRGLGRRDGG